MQFQIHILGTNSALPIKHRSPSAHLLNACERSFLIDCGEGTQMQLQKFELKSSKIEKIFISHLHGDHYYGLIGLISSYHLYRRKSPLEIYGPPILQNIINIQLKASNTQLSFDLVFHEIDSDFHGIIFEDHRFIIKTFPLKHRIQTQGYLFIQKQGLRKLNPDFVATHKIPNHAFENIKMGEDYIDEFGKIHKNQEITLDPKPAKSYAYCSDTAFDEAVADYVKGVDLLYHEATFADDNAQFAAEKFHSTAKQAAKIANLAQAKKLIIGHFSTRYSTLDVFLNEAQSVFPNTILAKEGLKIEI
jgi:ribonuclease Z